MEGKKLLVAGFTVVWSLVRVCRKCSWLESVGSLRRLHEEHASSLVRTL